jgi:hypothetical protein
MSARKIMWTVIFSALLLAPCLANEVDEAQSAQPPAVRARMPTANPLSIPYQVLRSPEGLALLKQSTHPEARDILAALGEEILGSPPTPITRELDAETEPQEIEIPIVSGPTEYGTRFNREPRRDALPQGALTIDFLPSGVAPGVDVIVGSAYDQRGLTGGLGGSASGYYVSRDRDNAPEYEGGLPPINDAREPGDQVFGGGIPWVVADPVHNAFFAADIRFDGTTSAIGLLRTSAATLRDPIACPNGTHTAQAAATCWPTKRLAFTRSSELQGDIFGRVDRPRLVVDSRLSGVGAGNLYVAAIVQGNDDWELRIVACANDLGRCSPSAFINNRTGSFDLSIRPDGNVTVSWAEWDGFQRVDLKYRSCTPAGPGAAPICGPVSLVQTETQTPILGTQVFFVDAIPEHDHALLGGGTETYVMWNRCKTALVLLEFAACPDTDIVMKTSTDDGLTWSPMTCVACEPNDQFLPAVGTDKSRNIVNVVYYSSQEDVAFQRRTQVYARQIVPTGNFPPVISKAQPVATLPNDASTGNWFAPSINMVARGLTWADSRLYVHFTYNNIQGRYFGINTPEQNNHLGRIDY